MKWLTSGLGLWKYCSVKMEETRRSAAAHLLGCRRQGRQAKCDSFSELIHETAPGSHGVPTVQRAIQTLTGSPLGPGGPASPLLPLLPGGP